MSSRNPNAGQPTGVRVSTDPADIDLDWLVPALSERAYWALGRSRDAVEAAISQSLCFVALPRDPQIGFARVITDLVTFAWVCDVFVDESAARRGRGHVADPDDRRGSAAARPAAHRARDAGRPRRVRAGRVRAARPPRALDGACGGTDDASSGSG